MRIGIFGIGAIGSVISILLKEEEEYFYFNRSKKEMIEIHFGTNVFRKKINQKKVDATYQLDWLIVCIKEYQIKSAEEDLRKLIGEQTKVAVIRNGLGLKESMLQFTNAEKVLACMIDCPIERMKDGHLVQIYKPIITIKKGKLANDFHSLFKEDEIVIHQVEDFNTANWKKVIESSALGGILALSGETVWIFQDPEVLALYKKVLDEGVQVAKKEGARISTAFLPEMIEKLKAFPPTKGSSMLTDRLRGNRIEINAKNGIISKYGKKHGIKTEINDLICTLLRYKC